jgi:hypothetical protein
VGEEAMAENPLGSGPFCLESWTKGQEVVLTPNPGYWDPEQPYVDEVVLRVVQDDNARLLQVRTGEVHIALAIPFSLAGALEGVEGVTTHMQTIFGSAAIVPNLRTVPALADMKVRQAMARAIDREAMVEALLFGNGTPAQSPFYGPGILFWTDEFAVPYDLEAAKALMAESGLPDGFSASLIVPSGDQLAQQTATIFADQMAELGIEIQINPVEAGTWWEMWSGGEFELVYKLGTNDVLDPADEHPLRLLVKGGGRVGRGLLRLPKRPGRGDQHGGGGRARSGPPHRALPRAPAESRWRKARSSTSSTRPRSGPPATTSTAFAVFPTKAHRFWKLDRARMTDVGLTTAAASPGSRRGKSPTPREEGLG